MKRTIDSESIVKPTKFAHFVLRVRDIDAAIGWYGTVLGMEVVHRNDTLAFLTFDDEHHRLALAQTPVADATPGAPGLDHVAYTLESLGDLLATYRRLKGEGITPSMPINHGLTTSIYYRDPDGNGVEFQVENFATLEECREYMATPAFAANPIGVGFDPEKLAERYESGEPLDQLQRPGGA